MTAVDLLAADPDRSSAAVLELPVPYRDTCAADLGLFLDLAPQEALALRRVDLGNWTVELRILGASHQVLAYCGAELACSETVACRPDRSVGAALPGRHQRAGHLAHHSFRADRHVLGPADFGRRVDELVADLVGATGALCGRFPGDERATTGLRLQVAGNEELGWCGWHSYPTTGEVVTTSSRLVLAPAAARCDR